MERVTKTALSMLAVAAVHVAMAQTAGQAGAGLPITVPAGFQTYADPGIHLTYIYPAELTPRDPGFAVDAVRRMLYGENAKAGQGKADTCAKALLAAGSGNEGQGRWGRVGLVEVKGECFPPKVMREKKATQTLLHNLVEQGTTVMGLMPLEPPTGYQIEGRWASFSAAQGQPLTGGDLQTAGEQVVGIVAVVAEGEVLAWIVETNDDAMFNRLLGSGVDFGTGKPDKLFPGVAKQE